MDEQMIADIAKAIWLEEENRARVAIDLPRLSEVLSESSWSKRLPAARAAHGVMAGRIAERDKVIGIASDALDVADNIITVNLGTDTPAEWDRAMRKVAKARAALAPKARHE